MSNNNYFVNISCHICAIFFQQLKIATKLKKMALDPSERLLDIWEASQIEEETQIQSFKLYSDPK